MWQNFNSKRGTQQQKTVGMETLNTHFFTNGIYFVQKNKTKRKKKSPNFVAGHHVVHFYFLQNQDLFQDLSTAM
jgi:hypothetical protein